MPFKWIRSKTFEENSIGVVLAVAAAAQHV